VEQYLSLLGQYRLVDMKQLDDDICLGEHLKAVLSPQLNYFYEIEASPGSTQARLCNASVGIFGLSGAGAYAALAAASARIGQICCVDDGMVDETDLYLAPILTDRDLGTSRAAAVGRHLEQLGATVLLPTARDILSRVDEAIAHFDFIICGAGERSRRVLENLNRACLRRGIPWTSCTLGGLEGVLGPTVLPGKTACFTCYKMRSIACAAEPDLALRLDMKAVQQECDDKLCQENLTFTAGILGNLAALEAFTAITGTGSYFAAGQIAVVSLYRGQWEKHTILRNPRCSSCFL